MMPLEIEEKVLCPALRGLAISQTRCHMIRKENIGLLGEKSAIATLCPCEKGGDMRTQEGERQHYKSIGTCPLCKRPDMRLYAYHGQDVCGGCKNKKEPGVKIKLTMLKEVKPFPEVDLPKTTGAHAKIKATEKSYKEIALIFHKSDETEEAIYQYLQAEAKRCRRTVNQQTMWVLWETMERADANHQA